MIAMKVVFVTVTAFTATAAFASSAASGLSKLTDFIEKEEVSEFKKEKTQLKSPDLDRLLETVLAQTNPEFLKHTLSFQKEALPLLKKNPDLAEIAVTEAPLEILKELDRKISLETVILSDGRNLLHAAASAGSIEQISFILEKYPKMILHLDKNGENPLSAAARRGDLQTIEALFKGKTKPVNVKNKKGQDAISIAKEEQFVKSAALIEKLLKAKK